jgi:5-(carboxyamino)imidazole ribonucleotide synthase
MPTALPRLEPGDTVGIFGGGQLGRMLAMACAKLGLRAAIYAPETDSAAFAVAASHVCAAYDDAAAVEAFATRCHVLTFEFESIPVETLLRAAAIAPVLPDPRAVAVAQNRIREKRFLTDAGLPVVPHYPVPDETALPKAALHLEAWPSGAILKRAAYGYDGKGQALVETTADLERAFLEWRAECVLEQRVAFTAEVSVIAVRDGAGRFSCYDVPRNVHESGILRRSEVPCGLPAEVRDEAAALAGKIADALDYVGVLGVEFFVLEEDAGAKKRLLINEIAPRVHNSGHWTLDACVISQFENHVRAVAGWPIGSTARHSDAVMLNLLGVEAAGWRGVLAGDAHASLYLYGKHGMQEGRKLGHVTRITPRSGQED